MRKSKPKTMTIGSEDKPITVCILVDPLDRDATRFGIIRSRSREFIINNSFADQANEWKYFATGIVKEDSETWKDFDKILNDNGIPSGDKTFNDITDSCPKEFLYKLHESMFDYLRARVSN